MVVRVSAPAHKGWRSKRAERAVLLPPHSATRTCAPPTPCPGDDGAARMPFAQGCRHPQGGIAPRAIAVRWLRHSSMAGRHGSTSADPREGFEAPCPPRPAMRPLRCQMRAPASRLPSSGSRSSNAQGCAPADELDGAVLPRRVGFVPARAAGARRRSPTQGSPAQGSGEGTTLAKSQLWRNHNFGEITTLAKSQLWRNHI
jgi:hypothetical protein